MTSPRSLLTSLAASAALLLTPAAASAMTFEGTVVHRNPHARAFVVATPDGIMRTVHSARRVRIGWMLRVRARWMRNGTWDALGVQLRVRPATDAAHASGRKWASACAGVHRRQVGRKWAALRSSPRHPAGRKWAALRCSTAGVRGTVTHVDPRTGALTVSGGGASVLVAPGARAARAAAALPTVGTRVQVETVLRDRGPLQSEGVRSLGPDLDGVDLGAVILGVDPVTRTLTVSADDIGLSGAWTTIVLPPGFDVSRYVPGRPVTLHATAWGTFALGIVYSSDNETAHAADDPADDQGVPPEPPASHGHADDDSGGPGKGHGRDDAPGQQPGAGDDTSDEPGGGSGGTGTGTDGGTKDGGDKSDGTGAKSGDSGKDGGGRDSGSKGGGGKDGGRG